MTLVELTGPVRPTDLWRWDDAMQRCARCGGRFPGPGVERNGHLYCCDKCAAGAGTMMLRMLAMASAFVGIGAAPGWTAAKIRR